MNDEIVPKLPKTRFDIVSAVQILLVAVLTLVNL